MKIISWNVHFDITEEQYSHIMEKESEILILEECQMTGFEMASKDWENALFYNDSLYDNGNNKGFKNPNGIAVFSNKYRFEFTDNFNRNYRYVVPLKVFKEDTFLFYLFIVWTKNEPETYVSNVIKAVEFSGYAEYLKNGALFIGDFNTPATKENRSSYDKLLHLGLVDCADAADILKPTYSHKKSVDYYTADYCFRTNSFKFDVKEQILDLQDDLDTKDKYCGLSDHVPLIVEVAEK